MPRLINKDFLARHHFLKRVWQDENLQGLFGKLDPSEQWDIHQYFQVINPGDDAAIVETRTTVNAGDDSLPQRAGRAYAAIFEKFQQIAAPREVHSPEEALLVLSEVGAEYRQMLMGPPRQPGVRTVRKGDFRIEAIMKPEIDKQKLARTLLLLAEYLDNERLKKEGKPASTTFSSRFLDD